MIDRLKKLANSLTLTNYLFLVFLLLFALNAIVSIIGNLITSFPVVANVKWLIAIALSLLGIFLLKKNMFVESYKTIIFFSIIVFVIIPSWFYGGGDNTITLLYLLLVAIVTLLIFEKNCLKVIIVTFCSLSCVALMTITYQFPHLINPSDASQNVFADNILQLVVIFILGTVLVEIFVKKYVKQNLLLKKLNVALDHAATTDVLSEAISRRKILEELNNYLRSDQNTEVYVFMLDIDLFKQVNDRFGHITGDKIIRYYADHLRKCVGEYGKIGRYGGDEFLIIFSNIEQSIIKEIAARIIKIESFGAINLTTSGGVMKRTEAHNLDALVHDADKLLFQAKNSGRDKIVLWDDTVIANAHNEQYYNI